MNEQINASYEKTTQALRAEAKRLLESGEVTLVIGWRQGRHGKAQPFLARTPQEAQELAFSPGCVNNLTLYLTKAKRDVPKNGKVAVVVKSCDRKALAGLLSESQLKRDELHVIGVACPGVSGDATLTAENIQNKCRECTTPVPAETDFTAGSAPSRPNLPAVEAKELARLEEMTPAERWDFWKKEFSRCVRCMACRQVCPFCYCERCLCDRNRPQGVENSPRPAGNMAWHIVRAMHLAGRCAGCAECERACPMEIPLNLLNRKMAAELKDMYGHEAGFEEQEKGPLTSYKENDDQGFIR